MKTIGKQTTKKKKHVRDDDDDSRMNSFPRSSRGARGLLLASMEVDGEDPPGPSGRAAADAPPRRWNQRGAPDEFAGPPPSGGHEKFWLSDGSDDEDDGSDEDYDDDELDRGARGAAKSGERAAAADDDDDAFYASSMDDEDERWVEKQRGGRVSDAILSCPCCLEIVTIDCQRHHRREGQYRAMFVRNVRVDASVALRPADAPDAADGTPANANARASAANEDADAEGPFHEVFCDSCGTSVGVRDADEVYHFFHVFPSNA